MSANMSTFERLEQERLRKRKLSEVANQDSALFRLLGSSLAPYKKWLFISMALMLVTSGLNAVPPYLLQQAIDGLKPGDLTAVLRTSRGFQVIKIETLEPGTIKPFDQSRDEIADRIANEKRRGELMKFMENLRAQAIIDWKNDEMKKAWELGLKRMGGESGTPGQP